MNLTAGTIFACSQGYSIEELLARNVVFEFDGSLTEIEAFVKGLTVFTPGTSLGGVESLVEVPSLMGPDQGSHESATTDIPETLVRLSVGIEDVNDLCEDLRTALP